MNKEQGKLYDTEYVGPTETHHEISGSDFEYIK